MKSNKAIKKLSILIIMLIILILVCISFFGIFKRNLNKWENILPEYSFSKEIDGVSSFSFSVSEATKTVEEKEETEEATEETEKVDDSVEVGEVISTEENATETQEEEATSEEENKEEETKTVPVNESGVRTKDNYIKTKKILQKRLESFGYSDYNIRLNEDNGNIEVEVPYGKNIESVIELVTNSGKIEIIDSDSKELLLDNSDIKSVSAYYDKSNSSTITDDSEKAYDLGIQISFNNDGLKKFQDLTKEYIETVGSDGESEIKSITIKVNDEDKYRTYFSVDGNYTYLSFPLYQGVTDEEVMNDDYRECIIVQDAVNAGDLPVIYSFESGTYMNSNNKDNTIKVSIIVMIAVVALISIYFILRNKKLGILALEMGYIASLLLIIRFANVTLSITGLLSVLGISILNFYYIKLMLENSEGRYLSATKKFLFNTIPLIIMMIVFNYSNTLQLKSVGMVMFWGFLISFVYNAILSNILLYFCDKETIKGADK